MLGETSTSVVSIIIGHNRLLVPNDKTVQVRAKVNEEEEYIVFRMVRVFVSPVHVEFTINIYKTNDKRSIVFFFFFEESINNSYNY